jgi:Tfp pilus assembly PilM family ATPase
MPFNVVGLDIGDRSVTAVLLKGSIGGKERVSAVAIADIPQDGNLEEAVREIFSRQDIRQATCVSAISAREIAFRNVSIPFTDERKIHQALPFTLEPLLQINIEDCVLDFKVVNRYKKAEVFAAAVPRTLVRDRIAMLARHVQEVAALDIETASIAAAVAVWWPSSTPGLILDIEERDAVAVWFSAKKILQVRRFPFGMEEQDDDSGRLVANLQRTFEYLHWQGAVVEGPDKIYLTGHGAVNGSMQAHLSQSLNVPVEFLDLGALAGIQYEDDIRAGWNAMHMDRALALALRPPAVGFNFKRRELEEKVDFKLRISRMRSAAIFAGLILVLGGINMWLDYRYDELRLKSLKDQVKTVFGIYAPEVTRIVDPVQQMRTRIAEAKRISLGTGADVSRTTALDALREISILAPPASDFLILSIDYGDGTIVIRGEAANFDAVETIKGELVKSKIFKSVAVGGSNASKEGGRVTFSLRIVSR